MPAGFVLASFRGSTYSEYASPLRLLRPRWTAVLNILCADSSCSHTVQPWPPGTSEYFSTAEPARGGLTRCSPFMTREFARAQSTSKQPVTLMLFDILEREGEATQYRQAHGVG